MDNLLQHQHRPLAQARLFAITLTFSGGFIDAFTYIECNHTLAGAQTGNIIFLSAALASQNFMGIIDRLGALIAFVVGLAIVSIFHAHVDRYWRVFCLAPIVIISAIVGALPADFPTYISVPALSFGLAMQNATFNKIQGLPYSSSFTSGNLKKNVVAFSEFYFHHDSSQLPAIINYSFIVASFTLGAVIAAFLLPYFRMHTIWLASLILLATNLIFFWQKSADQQA